MLNCLNSIKKNDIVCREDIPNKYKGNGLFSILKSHAYDIFYEDTGILIENMISLDNIYEKYNKYLSRGVPDFFHLMKYEALEDFDIVGIDGILSIIIIGLYYGPFSKEYEYVIAEVKDYTSFHRFDHIKNRIDVIIYDCTINKVYRPPLYFMEDEIYDPHIYNIKEKCRIAIVSNWATGTFSSYAVITEIKKCSPDYFISLGNDRYSGQISDFSDNFIKPIKRFLPDAKAFMIPGSHDYYSGRSGIDYALNQINQNGTFFSLTNSKVEIHGIDTGYLNSDPFHGYLEVKYNAGLVVEELMWHRIRIDSAIKNGKKIILMSHHEPISSLYPVGSDNNKNVCVNPELFSQFGEIYNDISYWLFGHDDSFDIMKPYKYKDKTLIRPRLLGNSTSQHYDDNKKVCYNSDIQLPVSKEIQPDRFESILNPVYIIMDIDHESTIKVSYYEVPQTSFGKFKKSKLLYQEVINS